MLRQEQLIKEQRTVQAIGKDYMGPTGKFVMIAKVLGSEILSQGSAYFEQSYLPDFENLGDDELPTMDIEETTHCVGYLFTGLTSGIHLEIKYSYDRRSVFVRYGGEVVYHEVAGELEGYAPNPEWESQIQSLFRLAKKKEAGNKENREVALEEISRNRLKIVVEQMKQKWGKLD